MKLYMVIPCYNEEEVLTETAKRLYEKYTSLIKSEKISSDSRIVFVNDGSKDKTWKIIKKLHETSNMFSGINLSRNRGHQNAVLAGLMTVKDKADAVISMDADLQDDIDAIDEMIDRYKNGCDIVYGVRYQRKTDTFFKKFTAQAFYKLMSAMGADVVYNHADYRLMSRRALNGLAEFKEVNLFLRGIVPMIGYKTETVYYDRKERFAGESKYPLKKMLAFAFEGITSMSVKPIKIIIGLSIIFSAFNFVAVIVALIRLLCGIGTMGTCIFFSVWLLGNLNLLAIGIVGEYVGKTYLETKQRPRYIVEEFINE